MSANNMHFHTATNTLRARALDSFESAGGPRIETGLQLSPLPDLSTAPAAAYFRQLARTLSRAGMKGPAQPVIAVTAANRGDGVSFTASALAGAIAAETGERALIVQADALTSRCFALAPADIEDAETRSGCAFAVKATSANPRAREARHVGTNLEQIRRFFEWVVVDCLSLRESDDALLVAPHVSGLVFVVAADKTKRSEIARAKQAIELASGVLLGFVLNKKTWPVPDSLYYRL